MSRRSADFCRSRHPPRTKELYDDRPRSGERAPYSIDHKYVVLAALHAAFNDGSEIDPYKKKGTIADTLKKGAVADVFEDILKGVWFWDMVREAAKLDDSSEQAILDYLEAVRADLAATAPAPAANQAGTPPTGATPASADAEPAAADGGGPVPDWKPPPGYVGVKAIQQQLRFEKHGKNPHRSTIDSWIQSDKANAKPIKATDSQEVHVVESWIIERIQRWNPRQASS